MIKGHVSKDHVHLLVWIPPQVTISRLVQHLKGKTAYKLIPRFGPLRKEFWGRHVWGARLLVLRQRERGGRVMAAYIENQGRGSWRRLSRGGGGGVA